MRSYKGTRESGGISVNIAGNGAQRTGHSVLHRKLLDKEVWEGSAQMPCQCPELVACLVEVQRQGGGGGEGAEELEC